uniref:Helicase POLQ-like n=1 Tax=Strongyloides papillosus TaxID=174720 RepID=A0A0N5BTB7_STREA
MFNRKKRMFEGQERSNDEAGGGRHSASLSSLLTKKVKKEHHDTGSLERMAQRSNLNTRNEEVFVSNGDFYDNPFDDPDDEICVLNADEVFKKIGFSQEVQDFYMKKKNIRDLHNWQKECLTEPNFLNGENFILSLKTGAGKNLVAELMMLREGLVNNKNCIIVLPYVAAAQEKARSLSAFEELEIFAEEYTGSEGKIPPVKRRKGQNIFVATYERANTLMDKLIKENRLGEIGLFVVDGLHMIGEKGRGDTVEKLIFKYLMLGSVQIIGMSSALGPDDKTEMCKFMRAKLFSSNFQPVKVVERVKIGDSLYNVSKKGDLIIHSKMGINDINRNDDSDGLISLIKGIVPQKSVVVFCPTKDNSEHVCEMIATLLPGSFKKPNVQRQEIIDNIKNENGGYIEETMKIGICAGIAYHHSGLTNGEKFWIETGFKTGALYALCATSTLCTGVNLPARCVIIKQPFIGKDFLEKSGYIQMIGRAGRSGYEGESITIVGRRCEWKFRNMLKSPLKSCRSQLLNEVNLEKFIKNLIYLKLVKNVEGLRDSLSKTLAGIQNNDECLSLMEEVLQSLKARDVIKIENGVRLKLNYQQCNCL